MNRQIVSSSNLRSVGYEPSTQVLEIEFRSGDVYQYSNVPERIYLGLINAASKGTYFHSHIRDRKEFPTRKIR